MDYFNGRLLILKERHDESEIQVLKIKECELKGITLISTMYKMQYILMSKAITGFLNKQNPEGILCSIERAENRIKGHVLNGRKHSF